MSARKARSGQVMTMVALLMVVIVGMAAFAIDGSNMYSQHRRLQADLDVAIKLGAARMYNSDLPSTAYTYTVTLAITDVIQTLSQNGYHFIPTSAVLTPISGSSYLNGVCATDTNSSSNTAIKICNPPVRGPFTGQINYMEGYLSSDVKGFFSGLIGLDRVHMSVRAVARQSGFHEPYAIIALSSTASCGLQIQGGTNTQLVVYGSTMSNSESCDGGSATPNIYGTSDMAAVTATNPMTGYGGTNYGVSPVSDPYGQVTVTSITTTTPVNVVGASSIPSACQNEVNWFFAQQGMTGTVTAGTYYFYPYTTTVDQTLPITAVQIQMGNSQGTTSQGSTFLFPGCDGSNTGVPGIYDVTSSSHQAGKAAIASYNSVVVFDQSLMDTGQATFYLEAPTSGPYQGIALSQQRTLDPTTGALSCPSTMPTIKLAGISSTSIMGVLDAPCADLKGIGNSNTTVNGLVVGNTITIQGSADDIVTYNPNYTPPDKGSVLVE